MDKKHKLTGIPNIGTAIGNYLKTEKGKKALAIWLFENDCVDYSLIEELKEYSVKSAGKIEKQTVKKVKRWKIRMLGY